jgi:hypothetical protein
MGFIVQTRFSSRQERWKRKENDTFLGRLKFCPSEKRFAIYFVPHLGTNQLSGGRTFHPTIGYPLRRSCKRDFVSQLGIIPEANEQTFCRKVGYVNGVSKDPVRLYTKTLSNDFYPFC